MLRNDIYNYLKAQGIDTSKEKPINVDEILENHAIKSVFTRDRLRDISEEVIASLRSLPISNTVISEFCSKLIEYRFIDQIFQLQKGKHIRWIRKQQGKTTHDIQPILTNGGILLDIKFTNKGVSILCKNKDRFIQYNFDDCLTYQKLSADEMVIIGCIELAE
jgi:hypothetical protein